MKKTIIAFVFAFISVVLFTMFADDAWVIVGNRPILTTNVDSITYDTEVNPPFQKVWKNGEATALPISEEEYVEFIEGLDVGNRIYRFENVDSIWKLMYITPIGYFFEADYADILLMDPDNNEEEITNDFTITDTKYWVYESFDGLHYADMTLRSNMMLDEMDYSIGKLSVAYGDSVKVEHQVEDDFFSYCRGNGYKPAKSDILKDALKKNLWYSMQNFDGYKYEECESELERLVSSFKSLLEVPLYVKSDSISVSKVKKRIENKIVKHKAATYGIDPITYEVGTVYDCGVENISGAIRCASYKGMNEILEYGFLIDENPENLTYEKAQRKVVCKQGKLSLTMRIWCQGLKRNTKYYYTVFCKIPKDQLSTYHFRYGDKKRTLGYGEMKSFTTILARKMWYLIAGASYYWTGASVPFIFYNSKIRTDKEYLYFTYDNFRENLQDGDHGLIGWAKYDENVFFRVSHRSENYNQYCYMGFTQSSQGYFMVGLSIKSGEKTEGIPAPVFNFWTFENIKGGRLAGNLVDHNTGEVLETFFLSLFDRGPLKLDEAPIWFYNEVLSASRCGEESAIEVFVDVENETVEPGIIIKE